MEEVALSSEQLARACERLLHPAPGSRIAAAREFGIDLTLLAAHLQLTPEERVRRMHGRCEEAEQHRRGARRPA